VSGHTRLYRRGESGNYYHRARVPVDIEDTYGRTEEKFSLKTKDYQEALRLVKITAVEVDLRFEEHRRELKRQEALAASEVIPELTEKQVKQLGQKHYAHLMEEDEDTRLEGFTDKPRMVGIFKPEATLEQINDIIKKAGKRKPNLENQEVELTWLLEEAKKTYARGELKLYEFDTCELLWGEEINLAPHSPSFLKLAREVQKQTIV